MAGRKNTDTEGRYARRGVSATKSEVHAAVARIDRGLYPGAFCKITEDFLTGDPDQCNIIHSDGSGTKSILAYLYWRETGDVSVFRGIAEDSIVMNLDDLICVGATGPIVISSTINRNARNIPAEALAELIQGTEAFLAKMRQNGIAIHSGGGETADVGDLTGTVVVDSTAVAVMPKKQLITGRLVAPGLAIVGLASFGRAVYESRENSGIGSNGLTSARHDLLSDYYRKRFPESFDKQTDPKLVYSGPYRMGDPLPGSALTVGEAILSPTRTYAPIVARLLKEIPGEILGLVHCSGGGQTKCLHLGRGVHFVKDRLMPAPPIFKAIQKASGTSVREMHQVFNMGHRMEVYCRETAAAEVIATSRAFGVEAAEVGHTEKSRKAGGANHLTLVCGGRKLTYG